VEEGVHHLPSEQEIIGNVPELDPILLSYPLYSYFLNYKYCPLPLVSFLLDTSIMQNLLELLSLSSLIVVNGTALTNKSPNCGISEIKQHHELLGSLNNKCSSVPKNQSMNNILQRITDAIHPLLGEYNITPYSDTITLYREARALDLDMEGGADDALGGDPMDVLTRLPILERPYRRCLGCHRASSSPRTTTGVPWRDRWLLVCPICSGKWENINN